MNNRTRMWVIVSAWLSFAGGGEDGCDCSGCGCDDITNNWADEPDAPVPASPIGRTLREASDYAEVAADSPTPREKVWYEIKSVIVKKGKWPKWYVERTPGADMNATWNCNRWMRGTNPIVRRGQKIKICGWR